MPMKPHKGESQSDFMGRCVPEMMGDGKRDNDQAVAACISIWNDKDKTMKTKDALRRKENGDDDYAEGLMEMYMQECPEIEEGESQGDYLDRCSGDLGEAFSDIDEDEANEACQRYWDENREDAEASYKEYADPGYRSDGKKRYPLDTPDLIRSSWYRANVLAGKKHYTDAQSSRIKARITAAWNVKIGKDGPPTDKALIKLLGPVRREAPALVMHKTKSTEGSGMEFILSDATPDRFGDTVQPSGWVVDNFKNNPIALFNHNSSFPIGKWKNIRVTDKDLRADLELAPRGTSDRIDEIRNLIDADILRATSVGFKPIEFEAINPKDPWGGTNYTKHELVECSVVAVPANPNALAVAKSMGVSSATLRMVFGEDAGKDITVQRNFSSTRGKDADKSGGGGKTTPPASMPNPSERERGKPMRLSERIQEAEKKHLALQDQLDKHLEGIDDDNPTEEQMVITEDLTAKIEATGRHLASLKSIEKRNGSTSTDTGSDTHRRKSNGIAAPAHLKLKEKTQDPIDYMFRAALVRCKAKADNADIDVVRQKIYGDDEVTRVACDMMLKAASAPAMTTVPTWAQELVRTIWAQFMEILLPQSVYPRLSAAGLALSFGANGRIVIPTRSPTPSISGSFVGEGQPIPVRQGAFSSQTLTPKKMAVITTWTREMDEYSIPAIEGLLRQAIMEDTAISLDTVLLDTNVATAIRPPGLRSYGAAISAAAGAAGQEFANFVADYGALFGALVTATSGNVRNPVIMLNPKQTLQLSLLQPPGAAVPLFPFVAMIDGGRLLRAGLIESATVPVDTAIMVDAADFTTAGTEGPRMEISDQATLHMEDTAPTDIVPGASPGTPASPVKSMWQTDSLALRMVMRMNWVLRRPVVAWMTGVKW